MLHSKFGFFLIFVQGLIQLPLATLKKKIGSQMNKLEDSKILLHIEQKSADDDCKLKMDYNPNRRKKHAHNGYHLKKYIDDKYQYVRKISIMW